MTTHEQRPQRMVAVITRSVFVFLKFQKPGKVTREEGKTMSLQKGSSAKGPSYAFC